MKLPKTSFLNGVIVGFLLGFPWLAFSYAGGQFGLVQIPVKLFEWITRILPGSVVTASLETVIKILQSLNVGPLSKLGKLSEFGMAYTIAIVGSTILGGVLNLSIQRFPVSWKYQGITAGLFVWSASLPIASWRGWGEAGVVPNIAWLLVLNISWGLAISWLCVRSTSMITGKPNQGRRQFLYTLAAESLAVSGLALILSRWLSKLPVVVQQAEIATPTLPEAIIHPSPTNSPIPVQTAQAQTSMPTSFELVEGTRSEITPIKDFYRVDINLVPPDQNDFNSNTGNLTQRLLAQGGETDLPEAGYILTIEGLVDNPVVLDLNSIKSFPAVDQYATLTCISNPVGGDLISTTLFRGARLKDVLDRAKLQKNVKFVKFTCVDGYTEALPIDAATDPRTLLCYAMGGNPLTSEHGAPIRLYTPGRYGMKNPKWIIKIEALNENYAGYWEQRGWDEDAFVRTTSVIDVIHMNQADVVEAGGIAFAGDREISQVELQIDENKTWIPAFLNMPLSPLTWVQWSVKMVIPSGSHELTVRANDGNGTLQIESISETHPDGATGYFSKPIPGS